ncbi:MAG: CBS domain-containing protein [bacterium]|nr:CBS domain-containing protein [bacterium]
MNEIPTIESVMIDAPVSIEIGERVSTAQDTMIDYEIRHLPVVEGGRLVGIISDRDVAVLENDPEWEGRVDALKVRDICALDVYAVEPETPLDEVLSQMAERRIGSVVVTRGGKIAGLFTATDACRRFAEHLRERSTG